MKKIRTTLPTLVVLFIVSPAAAQNGKYISFEQPLFDLRYEKKDTAENRIEIVKWKKSIKKAASMLPENFFKKTGQISWGFYVDEEDWVTGSALSRYNLIFINLKSNYEDPPTWMTWEPLRNNGFSEVERIYLALHEMAHIYDVRGWRLDNLYGFQYSGLAYLDDSPAHIFIELRKTECFKKDNKKTYFVEDDGLINVSYDFTGWAVMTSSRPFIKELDAFFCYQFWPDRVLVFEPESTLYGKVRGRGEDYAETFALYILWPEYLKANFPMHYQIAQDTLGREYKSVYPMPSSIKSRLTVKQ